MSNPSPTTASPTLPLAGSTTESLAFSGRALDFQCPACATALEVATVFGRTSVASCSQCHGFLIDRPSFADLISDLRKSYVGADEMPQPLDTIALEVDRHCPACYQTMETHPYYGPGNAVIDSCNGCQLTWFDAGEMASLVSAPGRRN